MVLLRAEAPVRGFGLDYRLQRPMNTGVPEKRRPMVRSDHERIDRQQGISWYNGEPVTNQTYQETYDSLWLPEHTKALLETLDQNGGITLIGGAGSGKSTLLYGARLLMRASQMPYVGINGRHKETPAPDIVEAIDSAEQHSFPIIYDSSDYLASSVRNKTRKIPVDQHIPRNKRVLERLREFRERGGHLLLTSHGRDWIQDFGHPELLPSWETLVRQTVPVEVDIQLPESSQRAALLRKIGLDPKAADFVAGLADDPRLVDYIINTKGDKKYVDWALKELKGYPILKLLVKNGLGDNQEANAAIHAVVTGEISEQEAWKEILDFAYKEPYLLKFWTRYPSAR